MTEHLSPAILTGLADGELQAQELLAVQEHLKGCLACTGEALAQTLLKNATNRAGQRFIVPPMFAERIAHQISIAPSGLQTSPAADVPPARRASHSVRNLGWATAASLLVFSLLSATWFLSQRDTSMKTAQISADNALVSEAFDQHVAALAGSSPPQVISSDNHTVKPWFQGKLPFAFNLPETLPSGMTLDGANLTYLHNQPTAQLLFSIGKHRVSVFVTKKTESSQSLPAEHAGFHVASFESGDLEGIAVSDVNPGRLAELVRSLEEAQNRSGH
jgi:anti-sigma factor RsiW